MRILKYLIRILKMIVFVILLITTIQIVSKSNSFIINADESIQQIHMEFLEIIYKNFLYEMIELISSVKNLQLTRQIVDEFFEELNLKSLYIKYIIKNDSDFEGLTDEIKRLFDLYVKNIMEIKHYSRFKDNFHNFILRMTGLTVFKNTIFPIIINLWPIIIKRFAFIKEAIIYEKIGPQNQIKLIKELFKNIFNFIILWLIGGPPWC